ncbi:MAG: aldehyde dehydrogenase family protein, partial [Desulfobacterales bacterium]|nr:aldehyde dehydrogenase family protein [Desulfobacterales bacterium]
RRQGLRSEEWEEDIKMEQVKNYVNGRWVDSKSGGTFRSINPANKDEVVGVASKSGREDVDEAVKAARGAYEQWRLTPAPRRGEILFRAAEILLRNKESLGKLETKEMGKILFEGLGDVQEAVDMGYYMAGEGRRLSGETVSSELPNKDMKSVRVPIGVFGLITPWNFPIAIPAWKVFPALICGNTIVFKPSSDTSVCAAKFVETLVEAGLPKGVLNLVHGPGGEVGEYLVSHPGVDAISFTGSFETGKRLEAIGGAIHRIIVTEMGGKNAIIVMDDANLDLAVEGAVWGGFGTSGQRCTAASRIVVHKKVYQKFIEKFKTAASRLKLGDGLHKETDMGPVINESQFNKILKYIEIGKKEGAKLILGGKVYQKGNCSKGYFIEPTIFGEVTPEMRIAQEEIFGPVVSVIKAEDLENAIQIVNHTSYGLSSAIYTQHVNSSAIAERDLETGIVYINASTIGAEIQLPFGGIKHSGYGRKEAGGRGGALDTYSRWKVIYRDFSGRVQKAQIDK